MVGRRESIEKYNIIENIEESNYATIYKVKDLDKKLFILKMARRKDNIYNELISREYQILSQFKHPNIVSVFDYSVTKDSRAYFTLEYFPGEPINEYFKAFSEEFISVIIQVINALGAFHNKGFIHSDLKPEHILYNPNEKRALLIDFGFAGIPSPTTTLAGTLGYVAPEVIKGIGIDQRSDLYSLGVIIHEILSGEKPTGSYIPIKDIPEEINNTIACLVSKEPAIRPTVPELYQTFSKYLTSVTSEIPSYQVELPNTGFIEIPEVVEKLLTIKGKAIIINGDNGTGKTRLLQEMKFKYLTRGCSVLYYISRGKITFYESLQNFIGDKEFDFANKEDRFQIYEEITADLIDFARDRQVIIMVDDIEELSRYEMGLFRYIGYGIEETNISLIGAFRLDERVNKLDFETLSLRPFSLDETKKLLEKTFFEIGPAKGNGAPVLTDFTHWLHKQSGGNPLFTEEILKALYKNGIIFYQANKWQIMDLLRKTSVPSKIEKLLETRIKELGADEIKILKVLSLAYHPLEITVLNLVLKSRNDIGIEHLKKSCLLKEEIINNRRVVYITNQTLVQLIEKSLNKKEKKLYLKGLINIIEDIAIKDKDYLPILGQLCDRVGDKEKAYRYFKSSVKDAETIYDYDSAIEYYGIMLKYEKENFPKKYPGTLIKIANINHIIGNNRIAIEYYNKALECKRKELTPVIYSGLGRVYSAIGQYPEAVKFLREAMALTKNRENQDYIKIAVYSLLCLTQIEEAKVILNQSFLLSKNISDAEMLAETMYYQAFYEWLKGDFDKGIDKAKENLRFTKENNLLKQFAYIKNLLSFLYQQKGAVKQAQIHIKEAINRFKEMKLINALASSLNNQAYLYIYQGDFSKAKDLFEDVLIMARQTNNQTVEYTSLANLGSINENSGRFDNAINLYKKALKIKPDALMANYNLSMVFYKKGEFDKARSFAEENLVRKEEILYCFAMAMIDLSLEETEQAEAALNKGLELTKDKKPDIDTKIEAFLKGAQFYYEVSNFKKSLNFSKKVIELADPSGKEYNLASALIKIDKFNFKDIDILDINQETGRLKEIGCIYDYAYLKRLEIESMINRGIESDKLKRLAEELSESQEILASLGAGGEFNRIKTIQKRLFPIVFEDYIKRINSVEYLKTFSRLAELINTNLGDKDFIQNTLDLIIKTTSAERGALFIKTKRGMKFVAGRNIDRTTIKDARELSRTSIKEIGKNNILFTDNALSDPNFNTKKSVILNKIRSLLCIPLTVSNNIIGAIYLDSRIASGIFGHKDKDFLLTVSRILASVIEKSLTFCTITKENILLKSKMIEEIGAGYILGKSASMKKVYRLIESVAETNSPVLILGETGTGKGMLARLIHLKSKRKNKKFLTINCGTIPETLLESELFGHKRGSFTGAISDKTGLLEEGESGTVLLDEITNTSLSFQAKLLEAIEEKKIRRLGEIKTRKIDVRFLFATNKVLETEVEEGRFRKDLFYRINVFGIDVPPLRKRLRDISVLAQFFLERYRKEINKDIKGFSPEAKQKLKDYHWPGNVRELQNIIERAVVLTKERLITVQDLGFERIAMREVIPLKELKKTAIIEALKINDWNLTKTAEQLDIGRATLWRYIKEYGIKN